MIGVNFRIALEALRGSKSRTGLTVLGVVIGVVSITLVLAIGEGAKQTMSQQVKDLDQKIILIRPGSTVHKLDSGVISYSPLNSYATSTLTETDVASAQSNKDVSAAAPLMLINASVKNGKQLAKNAPVVATSPELAPILKLSATEGQFIDGITERNTVVIGQQLAIDLFGTDQAIGKMLTIRGEDHTVIGVLKKVHNPIGINGVNINEAAIISLDAGKSFNQGIAQIQQINVQVKDEEKVDKIVHNLDKKIQLNHSGERDFIIITGEQASSISSEFYSAIVILTSTVAAVSLVVGGIGIMNIMLVSVSERTREIGIRKSLGASNKQILLQFLIEAIAMSLSGGVIGLIIAYILALVIGLFIGIIPAFSWTILLIALGLSLSVGVLFGLFPAIRAARKDPINALRHHD